MERHDLMRIGMQRLHAEEETIVEVLEKMEPKAYNSKVREIIRDMIDAAPARLARLEVICAHEAWPVSGAAMRTIDGWRDDVREFVLHGPCDSVNDAMILAMLMKAVRIRTSCYEAVYLIARNLQIDHFPELLSALWREDEETDDLIANVLTNLVLDGDGSWEQGFQLR